MNKSVISIKKNTYIFILIGLLVVTGCKSSANKKQENTDVIHKKDTNVSILKIASKKNSLGYKLINSNFDFSNIPTNYLNSIWEIKHFHNLSNKNIKLPENVTLYFNGGKFANGNLIGKNTKLKASANPIFTQNLVLKGSWNVSHIYPEWFGAIGNGVIDDKIALQKTINFTGYIGGGTVVLSANKNFLITSSLKLKSNVIIKGEGATTSIKTKTKNIQLFSLTGTLEPTGYLENIGFDNFKLINSGNISDAEYNHCISMYDVRNGFVHNMIFENSRGDGLYIRDSKNVDVFNIYCKNTRRQGIALTRGTDISIVKVRGEGTMINLVDIEPNKGDTISNLIVKDVKISFGDSNALGTYVIAPEFNILSNVRISDIETKEFSFTGATNLVVNNIITKDFAVFYKCKEVKASNIRITGGVSQNNGLFYIVSSFNSVFSDILIEGNNNILTDVLGGKDITINDLKSQGVGTTGLRIRETTNLSLNNATIKNCKGYAIYMLPNTGKKNTNTIFTGLSLVNCAKGIYANNDVGDIYLDANLEGVLAKKKINYGPEYIGKINYKN